jgi:hypothetical protein
MPLVEALVGGHEGYALEDKN